MLDIPIHNETRPIVVTGAKGQLGTVLCRLLGPATIGLDVQEMDLTNASSIQETIAALQPRILINTAAYTQVDRAETDAERCYSINTDAVETLAALCDQLDCYLVQISTDYVFGQRDAQQPAAWRETDPVEPHGVYARSKYLAEQAAAQAARHLVVRTCGLYGEPGPNSPGNFVLTMLRLAKTRDQLPVVDDQWCSPTWVEQLSPALLHLVACQATGIYHLVNPGAITWCRFAKEIFQYRRLACRVQAISTEQYDAPAPRPRYSVLSIEKYLQFGQGDSLANKLLTQRDHDVAPPLLSTKEAVRRFLDQRDQRSAKRD